jgi:2-hydroxychromene-2-carboxylate isomerase
LPDCRNVSVMNIDFWLDPVCPWCWLSSRWILDVAPHRDLEIQWRPISLFMKNNPSPDSPFYERTIHTLGLLRVMESVRAAEGNARLGALYTAYGTRIHHNGETAVDAAVGLKEAGIDVVHASAFADDSWDEVVRAGMDEGLALVGTDVGTPIIGFPAGSDDTKRVGFFGPVISRRLALPDALQLWDGLALLTGVDAFWELKRTRTENPDFTPVNP